jgi:hypothetical protein
MTATDFTSSSFGVCQAELQEWTEERVVRREGKKCLSTKRNKTILLCYRLMLEMRYPATSNFWTVVAIAGGWIWIGKEVWIRMCA